jgi:Zn finger protein HypA/HybF involved in hydrogenase expression
MSSEWMHFNISCRDCKNKGTLSIWSDERFRWGAGWEGFKGTARITGPQEDTIQCLKCNQKNIQITKGGSAK